MDIKGILENPIVKTMLLKKLEKAWSENNLHLITITKDANGNFEFNIYDEPQIIISKKDFSEIINS